MKTVALKDLQKRAKGYLGLAQKDRVVITRNGKPSAILVGVEGMDWEDVIFETNEGFWKLIEKRRRQKTIPISELRNRLNGR